MRHLRSALAATVALAGLAAAPAPALLDAPDTVGATARDDDGDEGEADDELEGELADGTDDGGPLVFAPQGVSTDRFDAVTEPERIEIEAHDGVMLHARLYRPDTSSDPDWEQPVILVHSPYYDGVLQGSDTRSLDLVERFTPKGYAVVLSDVRGTGNSGGCAEQDGPNQAQDFATWVEHLAELDWTNGKVGSYGKSYDAETQNAGVVLAPEGLETMVTVAGISSLYDVGYFDGVPLTASGLLGAVVYTPISFDIPTDSAAYTRYHEKIACQPANYVNGADPRGDMTDYWADREFRTGIDGIDDDVSVLHVHGLHDGIVTPIAIDGWYDELPGFTRAIWGQWEHKYPYDAPAAVARDDWYETIHAWFDRFLLDLDTDVEAWPPVQVQSEDGSWRGVESYAGMGVPTELLIGADALGSAGDGEVQFTEDDALVVDSDPFTEGLHLSGQAQVDLDLAIDRPDGHLVVQLQELYPGGSTRTLSTGYLSMPHRTSLVEPDLTVPMGRPQAYRVQTMPFDATLMPGSSLRLRISGSGGGSLAANTDYTATMLLGSSVLRIPVVEEVCGLAVAERTGSGATAGCPHGIPATVHPTPSERFTETSRG